MMQGNNKTKQFTVSHKSTFLDLSTQSSRTITKIRITANSAQNAIPLREQENPAELTVHRLPYQYENNK